MLIGSTYSRWPDFKKSTPLALEKTTDSFSNHTKVAEAQMQKHLPKPMAREVFQRFQKMITSTIPLPPSGLVYHADFRFRPGTSQLHICLDPGYDNSLLA